jgi:sortase A
MDETIILRFREREPMTHRRGSSGRRRTPIRTTLRTIGELMITTGLVLLLFASYEIWGKSVIINDHQNDLNTQLNQQWAQPDDPTVSSTPGAKPKLIAPPPGGTIARMYIPRLGKHWVVVEGVDQSDIAYAPGHYPRTALPGDVGNFAVAGHRVPAIWWDLDEMQTGDLVIVQTRTMYYIYRVTVVEIVKPTDIAVVAPLPDQPGKPPTQAMLTLTTCNPKWDNYQRLIVHAALVPDLSRPASQGAPPQIQGS